MTFYAGVFIPLERLFPSKRQAILRRGSATDAAYWFLPPLALKACSAIFHGTLSVLALGWLLQFRNNPVLLGALPAWAQALGFLFALDFFQYWWHRLLHKAPLWNFHVVHHSSTELDWLTTSRRHPVEIFLLYLNTTCAGVAFAITPAAAALVGFIMPLLTFLPHANLNWTFGPLRYVVVSPVFHRWHHTHVNEGGLKNFAVMFSCIDLMFGTYYLPDKLRPCVFGVPDDSVPENILRQLVYPLFKKRVPSSKVNEAELSGHTESFHT
jgi:sterol desaturase/sphingolipid hydroxylase (fatty acid hydroxylase superfamily)